jgi:hypothetical protein
MDDPVEQASALSRRLRSVLADALDQMNAAGGSDERNWSVLVAASAHAARTIRLVAAEPGIPAAARLDEVSAWAIAQANSQRGQAPH